MQLKGPDMIEATINGRTVQVSEGTTILEAARQVQVQIPTLCNHPDLPPTAACGICVVKAEGSAKMLRACCTPIEKGMRIITHDPEIIDVRRSVLELILSNHPNSCLTCGRNGTCELQSLAEHFAIWEEHLEKYFVPTPKDATTGAMTVDPDKCIHCGRCIEICQEVQQVWALSFLGRGINSRFAPAAGLSLKDSPCVVCGQCSAHCPTGALFELDQTQQVWQKLQNPENVCVVQIAPAVRVAIGEAFGCEPGTNMTGKLYTVLRRIGFEAVFDTNFGADVTIMEEASEFIERFTNTPEGLPLITTCCPSWVDYMETRAPDMIEHFSSCKSPHQIVGVLTKTYYARRMKIDPAKIVVVSIMPCTSKKTEIARTGEMFASGYQDVDFVLTTRELARMIKQTGKDFLRVPEGEPDHLLGDYTGAATIFGVTGGVMEAALRSAYYFLTKKKLEKFEFQEIRGLQGVKEHTVDINGTPVRIAVAHGLGNVEFVLNKIREAKRTGQKQPYDFIEVMACPGGCIGGGGQPYGVTDELRRKRTMGLYADDERCVLRCSHENPFVQQLYEDFLGSPLSDVSHKLLHTHYESRSKV
jgi:NADH-quinone oxidoreductase subunit G